MKLLRLLGGHKSGEPGAREIAELRAEVDRLRAQNAKMKVAMRHCIECEYRIEIIDQRAASSASADGTRTGSDEQG